MSVMGPGRLCRRHQRCSGWWTSRHPNASISQVSYQGMTRSAVLPNVRLDVRIAPKSVRQMTAKGDGIANWMCKRFMAQLYSSRV